MSMTTRNTNVEFQKRDMSDVKAKATQAPSPSPDGPEGAEFVDSESEGKPSMAYDAPTQSPASLDGNKTATLKPVESTDVGQAAKQSPSGLKCNQIASFSGAEGKQA